MEIAYLPTLNSLCPLNSKPPYDDTSFHFLCNQKVEIGSLKSLKICELKDNISNKWCNHISINFFRNLEELNIYHLNGIRNLMSSSIAKNLVSLNHLSIRNCQEMVEVIEDEEEIADLYLFPALKWLDLYNLLKLRSFCQCKHTFELSLLEFVTITNCPEMETFTLGSLSKPNIKLLTINWKHINDTKDLNGTIHYFRTESQEEDEDEDEYQYEYEYEDVEEE